MMRCIASFLQNTIAVILIATGNFEFKLGLNSISKVRFG
jgi:hypothetical protein